jgi:hypothetical protein
MHFGTGSGILGPKIQNSFLFPAFELQILDFCVQKLLKFLLKVKFVTFEIVQYECENIQNFMLVSFLKEHFLKCPEKG